MSDDQRERDLMDSGLPESVALVIAEQERNLTEVVQQMMGNESLRVECEVTPMSLRRPRA